MPERSRKRPTDVNQLAASVVADAVGDRPETADPQAANKDPAAVSLGRRGGLVGGKRRAENMTKEQRSAAARKAAQARWQNRSPDQPA